MQGPRCGRPRGWWRAGGRTVLAVTFSIVARVGPAYGVAVASKFLGRQCRPGGPDRGGRGGDPVPRRCPSGPTGWPLLADGVSAAEAARRLLAPDLGREERQLGIVGARDAATFTGSGQAGGPAGLRPTPRRMRRTRSREYPSPGPRSSRRWSGPGWDRAASRSSGGSPRRCWPGCPAATVGDAKGCGVCRRPRCQGGTTDAGDLRPACRRPPGRDPGAGAAPGPVRPVLPATPRTSPR